MPNYEAGRSNLLSTFPILLHLMSEVRVPDTLLANLDKEIVIYWYDYDRDEAEHLEDGIKLWGFIITMYILNRKFKSEKIVEKLENIIKQPKILVVFIKSLKKILYIWLKEYYLHCSLLMKVYPELYNPKRLLKLYGVKISE